MRPFHRSLKDTELVAQCQILGSKRRVTDKHGADEQYDTGHDAHRSSSFRDL
jgi:hypothetical protein